MAQAFKNLLFLGTPRYSAPLEQAGNWIDIMQGSDLVSRAFAAIGEIRSGGIADLRHGYV